MLRSSEEKMRQLYFVILATSMLFGQTTQPKTEKTKFSDFESTVVKIVVVGVGPSGYTSIGTGFFVGDHSIASAAHVYLDAAKAIIDGGAGVGTICGYKVFRDGRKPFYFPLTYRASDFAHDTVLLSFNADDIKKQQPDFEIKPVKIGDDKPELGDDVLFLGYFAGDDLPILSRTTIAGFTAPVAAEQLILDIPANPRSVRITSFRLTDRESRRNFSVFRSGDFGSRELTNTFRIVEISGSRTLEEVDRVRRCALTLPNRKLS
jgi:hypothetical protein